MVNPLAGHLGGAPFKYFADWTDRIAKGELPHSKPKRPEGVERNIVVTWWENRSSEIGHRVGLGIEDRQRVSRIFGRAEEPAVCIDGRIASIGRDQVVQILLWLARGVKDAMDELRAEHVWED